jgi:hypothetical protein
MCDNCLIIQSVSLVIGIAFVSGRCAGACRTVLVSAALRWSLPHRPCIGGSALVLVALPLHRGVALVIAALPLYRGVALVIAALPLYRGVEFVTGITSVYLYRLLCARHWWCVGVSRLVRCRKVSNFFTRDQEF